MNYTEIEGERRSGVEVIDDKNSFQYEYRWKDENGKEYYKVTSVIEPSEEDEDEED